MKLHHDIQKQLDKLPVTPYTPRSVQIEYLEPVSVEVSEGVELVHYELCNGECDDLPAFLQDQAF